jgi:hypothetical protein
MYINPNCNYLSQIYPVCLNQPWAISAVMHPHASIKAISGVSFAQIWKPWWHKNAFTGSSQGQKHLSTHEGHTSAEGLFYGIQLWWIGRKVDQKTTWISSGKWGKIMGENHTCWIGKIYQLRIMMDSAVVHYHNTLFSRPDIHSGELSNTDSMKKVCKLCCMHHLFYNEITELITVKQSEDWAHCIIATDANCCHHGVLITTHKVTNEVCVLSRRCTSIVSSSIVRSLLSPTDSSGFLRIPRTQYWLMCQPISSTYLSPTESCRTHRNPQESSGILRTPAGLHYDFADFKF